MAYSNNSGSSSGFSSGVSTSSPVMNPGAGGYYQDLLTRNQNVYKDVLSAYGGGLRNAQAQLPGIYQGYGQLNNNVRDTLGLSGGGWGVATPAAQAIQRTFEQTQGQNQQNLINAGLGNSTVLANLNTGAARQASEAFGGLGAQLAQTYAGYQGQFGLAQLGARQQGLGLQTGLSANLGNALAGYHFANTFGNLYGQNSVSQNQSQNASSNFGSSYSPSGGGGGGYGGGSANSPNEGTNLYGYNAGAIFPGNYLGGTPSGYYGTGAIGGGSAVPTGSTFYPGAALPQGNPYQGEQAPNEGAFDY